MDGEAAAAFFATNVRILEVEKREIQRDKRRWRRLFNILKADTEQDVEDEARLVEIQTEIDSLKAKIDALKK